MRNAMIGVVLALAWVAFAVAAPTITRDQARAAADEVIRLIEAHYVFPDKRAAIAGAVRAARDAGRYDIDNPQELAERVTSDLQKASNDGHLSLSVDPEGFDELKRPPSRDDRRPPPANDDGRLRNHGYEEMRVLAGNVRLVRITGFIWFDDTARIVDAAARFLADGDAVIIDLRGNGGGSAEAVQRLVSYFFPGGGQELMRFHDGISGKTGVNRVLKDLPSPRLNKKPLFVLTDGGTGSAAEEFAYHVQQFNLGALVGRTTAGAANNNEHYPVAPFFVASISVGRPEHPVSRTNWEGKGVAPHVETVPAAALDQAHVLALQKLAENASPERRRDLEWAMGAAQSRVKPVRLSDAELDAYVGVYGIRKVFRDGQTLMFQREQREPTALIPMGGDLFGFANSQQVRLQFKRVGGRVVGFDQVTKDGVVNSAERTG